MYVHGLLFKSEKLSYICLYHLAGKETPHEGTWKHSPSHNWFLIIFDLFPLLVLNSSHTLVLVCKWFHSLNINDIWSCEFWRINSKKLTDPECISNILTNHSLLTSLISHSLTQYPNSIPELNISDLSLGLHFWCIRNPLILGINIYPNKKS